MKSNNYNISEDEFLKNKARRKNTSEKPRAKRKKKKSSNPALKGFLIALGVLVGIIVVLAAAALIYYFAVIGGDISDDHNQNNDNFINSEGNEVNRLTGDDGGKKYFTFLATATDYGGSLTDVIMVARFHYDDKDPSVSLLQIPRDTYVKIANDKLYFTDDGALSADNFSSETASYSIKINEAFYRGKKLAESKISALLKEVDGKTEEEIDKILKKKEYIFIEADPKKVKNYAKAQGSSQKSQLESDIMRDFGLVYLQNLIYYDFGIPIDYHAQVNIKGFRGVVDAIDGIDLYVPQDMDYDDPFQDLHIHLKKGQQHLNGRKAEQFVRFRGYPEGDVARLDAQKRFIDAFLDKLLSFSTVTKIDDIITEIQSNVYTDISFNNMLRFANKILLMNLKEDIHMYTLPGTGEYIGPVSYFVANRADTIKLVNEEFNVFNTPLIDEDFKIVDNEKIYRPASVVTDEDEENIDSETTEEADGETDTEGDNTESEEAESENSEDNDENNSEENTSGEAGKEDKEIAEEDGKKENADVTADENTDSEAVNSENTEEPENQENAGEAEANADNKKAGTSAEEDENYQLLLDMAA